MKKICIALLLVIISRVVSADFDSAFALYEQKKFEEAATEFRSLAEKGSRDSQFNLGVMYLRGEFYEKDPVEAYAWIALSVSEKAPEREQVKNNIYAKLDPQQKKMADDLLVKYSSAYSKWVAPVSIEPELMDKYVDLLGKPIKRIAPVYPKSGLVKGQEAIIDLIFMVSADGRVRHINSLGINNDFVKASVGALKKFTYQPSGDKDYLIDNAYVRTVFTYEMEKRPGRLWAGLIADSVAKTIDKHKDKALAGSSESQFILGYTYGKVSSKMTGFNSLEIDNPNKWYLLAANQGLPQAQFMLGINMMCGNMCREDSQKGLVWIARAAERGSSEAQLYLAMNLLEHYKQDNDVIEALKLLDLAAQSNDSALAIQAWILATSKEEKFLNPKKAAELIARVPKDYWDQLSYLETQAAVAARNGNYEAAQGYQEQALDEAEKYDYPVKWVKARLESYENKKPWSESIN